MNENFSDSLDDTSPGDALSLPELAYRRIRASILSAEIPPGSDLKQEQFAKEYGISRVPLREAMSRLHAEGLILKLPRRGFVVPSLTIAEIIEICELNMVIEEHAAVVATRERTEKDVADVEAILLRMEALDLNDPDHLSPWQELAPRFHRRMFMSARRRRVQEVTSNLRDALEPYIRLEDNLLDHIAQSNKDHREIFDAFRARDTQAAGRLTREHADNIRRHLLNSFSGTESVPPTMS
jgi:DNA-binding GntR family transcriptional regulator